jgi:hypothetical protein
MGRSRDDEDDDDYDRPRRSTKPKRKGSSRSQQQSNPMLLIGLGGGGLAVVVILILVVMGSRRRALPPPPSGDGSTPIVAGTTPGVPATVKPSAEQNAANQAAYEARLERDRLKSAENQKADMQKQFGADKVVTVIVKGVPGDPAAADKYLNRKLFRAAYHDYSESAKRAQAQTDQNREQAKQQALSQAQAQGAFGPVFVQFRYQEIKSDLPYPRIIVGSKANGTFIYHAAPVLALDQFASRFDIGDQKSIDQSSRTVTVESQLPNPVPDPDVEELYLQYGRDAVAKLVVKGAKGDPDRVNYYLESQAAKLDPNTTLSIAGLKLLGPGDYELYLGPVADLNVFAARIPFGTVSNTEPTTRVVTVDAKLPDDLPTRPTPAELAEIRRKEWDKMWNKPSIFDDKPREGEDFFEWVKRILKGNHSSAAKAALVQLKLREVDDEHLKEMSDLLIETLKDSWNVPEHLDAMAVWKGPGTEKAVIGLIGDIHFHRHSKSLMEALAKFGTKESARALTMGLTDRSYGDDAVRSLIEMGSVAEEFVIKFVDNREDGVRTRVYDVLAEIGTEKSIAKLRSNIGKEKDTFMKDRCKEVIELIKTRGEESKATTDPNSPFATKPKK